MGRVTILAINGPTASGKSGVAVEVALRLIASGHSTEIINADSMLVYKGMDIGTAKPSMAQRRGVEHHLVDIWEVTEQASVAELQRLARAAIAECQERGVIPVVVGGSALYMRAILDVFEFPATDANVRAKWDAELERLGSQALHDFLAQVAPDVASGILPGNGRRIVRALEVIELTGSFAPTLPSWTYALEGVVAWGLELPRSEMDARIDARVDQMWDLGFVAEVRTLTEHGLRDGKTASMALGYRQILQHLAGELTDDEARDATKRATRRFARKQLAWFRRDARIKWRPAGSVTLVDEITADVLASVP